MNKLQLQEQLIQAMKSGDDIKKSTLRMLISAISYFEIQKGLNHTATESEILSVVTSEVKKHRDSIEQYQRANRQDLVNKEMAELKILEKFMPEQMDENEIKMLVDNAITKTNATTPQDMGKVMSVLIPLTKGKADGSLVSKLVKEKLQ